jgi:hypothetical protein
MIWETYKIILGGGGKSCREENWTAKMRLKEIKIWAFSGRLELPRSKVAKTDDKAFNHLKYLKFKRLGFLKGKRLWMGSQPIEEWPVRRKIT